MLTSNSFLILSTLHAIHISLLCQVRVFEHVSKYWKQLGSDIYGTSSEDRSGFAISMAADGNTIAVGSSLNDDLGVNGGQVRIFELVNEEWVKKGKDINGSPGDRLGTSLSLSEDGKRFAVGSPLHDRRGVASGNIKIYTFKQHWFFKKRWSWIKQADIMGENEDEWFGYSVSLSTDGRTVVAGGYQAGKTFFDNSCNGCGVVRIYRYVPNFLFPYWNKIGDLKGENEGDWFGYSVSTSDDGNRLVVGAPQSDAGGINSGYVQVYDYMGFNWLKTGKAVLGTSSYERCGFAVSMSDDGDLLAVGSPTRSVQDVKNIGLSRVFGLELIESQVETYNPPPLEAIFKPPTSSPVRYVALVKDPTFEPNCGGTQLISTEINRSDSRSANSSRSSGIMFDVVASNDVAGISIKGFDINISISEDHSLQVFTRTGSHILYQKDRDSWTNLGIYDISEGETTAKIFFRDEIVLSSRQSKAFFLVMLNGEGNINTRYYSDNKLGEVDIYNDNLAILIGSAIPLQRVTNPFSESTSTSPGFVFFGEVNYSVCM